MPERFRSIVVQLREYVGNRRRAQRYRLRLACSVAPYDPDASGAKQLTALKGLTRDASTSGLALILPAVRVGDRYLTGADTTLRVVLELTTGPLELLATPMRHEQLGPEETDKGFLIGVRIKEMSAADRARYEEYLTQPR
jgi:PilZ domain